jgi:hypothetical protein
MGPNDRRPDRFTSLSSSLTTPPGRLVLNPKDGMLAWSGRS